MLVFGSQLSFNGDRCLCAYTARLQWVQVPSSGEHHSGRVRSKMDAGMCIKGYLPQPLVKQLLICEQYVLTASLPTR